MSNELQKINSALIDGDLSKLSPQEKLNHYMSVCNSLGLNPLTKPFAYLQLNSKLVLYATRDCTDQLRASRKISMTITDRTVMDDIYVVTARAKTIDGLEDESTGAVNIAGLKGEQKANAFMKAETKAKRRLTLSICGLGFTDESEIESIPGAKIVDVQAPQNKAIETNTDQPKQTPTIDKIVESETKAEIVSAVEGVIDTSVLPRIKDKFNLAKDKSKFLDAAQAKLEKENQDSSDYQIALDWIITTRNTLIISAEIQKENSEVKG